MFDNNSQDSLRIGLIGNASSGKTTFLTALEKYVQVFHDPVGPWNYRGRNADTRDWLLQQKSILRKGTFFDATQSKSALSFLLNRGDTNICLETEDRPGGDYSDGIDESMLDYLSTCTGFIFLINPVKGSPEFNDEKKEDVFLGDSISNLLSRIEMKINNGEAKGRLNQRVAVCLTQYDDAVVFNWLKANHYLEKRVSTGIRDTPFLPSPNVIETIRKWTKFEDGNEILYQLATRFLPENVNFFGLSSIGFFKQNGNNLIDWSDCNNVSVTPAVNCIRNAPHYLPVNLLAPFGWIINHKKKSSWRIR